MAHPKGNLTRGRKRIEAAISVLQHKGLDNDVVEMIIGFVVASLAPQMPSMFKSLLHAACNHYDRRVYTRPVNVQASRLQYFVEYEHIFSVPIFDNLKAPTRPLRSGNRKWAPNLLYVSRKITCPCMGHICIDSLAMKFRTPLFFDQ